MKRVLLALLVLFLTSIFADAEVAYKKCVACHGINGEKVALGKSKVINEMSKNEFISAMKGYKDGTYGRELKAMMKAQVINLSDEDIIEIAEKIAK